MIKELQVAILIHCGYPCLYRQHLQYSFQIFITLLAIWPLLDFRSLSPPPFPNVSNTLSNFVILIYQPSQFLKTTPPSLWTPASSGLSSFMIFWFLHNFVYFCKIVFDTNLDLLIPNLYNIIPNIIQSK